MSEALGKAFLNLPRVIEKSNPDLILSGFDIAANFALTLYVGSYEYTCCSYSGWRGFWYNR